MHDMTSSADWTGVRPVTEKMPAAVLACGEQIEMKSPAEVTMESHQIETMKREYAQRLERELLRRFGR